MVMLTEADAQVVIQALTEAIVAREADMLPSGPAAIPENKSNREAWLRGMTETKMEFVALKARLIDALTGRTPCGGEKA